MDPDLATALGDALVFGGLELAAVQRSPELAIAMRTCLDRFDEHAVMPALDLGERIAHRGKEVRVRDPDRAVHVELDHRLRLADRVDLAVVVGGLELLLGHVGRELDDLERLAAVVEDRVVAGEDPDLAAALGVPLEFAGLELAAVQPRPEIAIRRAVAVGRRHEHAVMLALDLGECVAHRTEEVLVGGDDGAVHVELDHRLRTVDRGDLAGVFHAVDLLRGDVGGELDDADRLAVLVHDRVVGGLDPDLAAALGDTLVLCGLVLAAIEARPERAIIVAVARGRVDEHAVVLAPDLVERVAHRVQEILVGGDDGAVELELDHRLRLADRCGLRQRILDVGLVAERKHQGSVKVQKKRDGKSRSRQLTERLQRAV